MDRASCNAAWPPITCQIPQYHRCFHVMPAKGSCCAWRTTPSGPPQDVKDFKTETFPIIRKNVHYVSLFHITFVECIYKEKKQSNIINIRKAIFCLPILRCRSFTVIGFFSLPPLVTSPKAPQRRPLSAGPRTVFWTPWPPRFHRSTYSKGYRQKIPRDVVRDSSHQIEKLKVIRLELFVQSHSPLGSSGTT